MDLAAPRGVPTLRCLRRLRRRRRRRRPQVGKMTRTPTTLN